MAWAMETLDQEGGIEKFSDLYIAMRWMQGAIEVYTDDLEPAEARMKETYALALKAQLQFLFLFLPTAPVFLLVLPERGIAGARPGLDA